MTKNIILSMAISALLLGGSFVSSAAIAQTESGAPAAENSTQGDHAKKSGNHKKAKKAHKAKHAKRHKKSGN